MNWHEDPEELKKVRKRLGVSQEKLGELSGVKPSWIAAVETKRLPLIGPKAHALWRALGDIDFERRADLDRRGLMPLSNLLGLEREPTRYGNPDELKRMETMERLIATQNSLIAVQNELLRTANEEKDARIAALEQKVSDLRNLYEVETEAALAHDRAEELREKISASGNKVDDEK